MSNNKQETRRLTALQQEALIQFQHDPGARGLHSEEQDTESKVELEAYVCERSAKPAQEEESVA